jgi:hypothetical protein
MDRWKSPRSAPTAIPSSTRDLFTDDSSSDTFFTPVLTDYAAIGRTICVTSESETDDGILADGIKPLSFSLSLTCSSDSEEIEVSVPPTDDEQFMTISRSLLPKTPMVAVNWNLETKPVPFARLDQIREPIVKAHEISALLARLKAATE